MEPLDMEDMQKLTKYVGIKILSFMHETWSKLLAEHTRLMTVMIREFPSTSDEHNIHALGMRIIDFFYDKYLPEAFLDPPPHVLSPLFDLLNERIGVERAKLFSSTDPKWIRQLEDLCAPTLFEHNIRWILTEVTPACPHPL